MRTTTSVILGLLLMAVPVFSQEWNGFVEFGYAPKLQKNASLAAMMGLSSDGQYYAIGEQRVQLKFEHFSDEGELFLKMDFLRDNVFDKTDLLVREAYFTTTLVDWMDLKIGRQIQTWGVGDLMFINDVFPKDWISFFSGRQDEYLKAPSNALRFGLYPENPLVQALNISVMPFSESDINVMTEGRFASIDPLYSFMANQGIFFGPAARTSREPENFEIAMRVQLKSFGGFTTSLYGYKGRWNNPYAIRPDNASNVMTPYFSKLQVYGASTRGAALGGVLSFEGGYYRSVDDLDGINPLVPNSSLRYLALYEKSLAQTLDMGIQYYGEALQNFENIDNNVSSFLQSGGLAPLDVETFKDEFRHLLTLRLTKKMLNETLWLTWFNYFSPSDQDFYLRPSIQYKYSDQVSLTVTGNIFGAYGDNNDEANRKANLLPDYRNTMFGQFSDDRNINFTARYIF